MCFLVARLTCLLNSDLLSYFRCSRGVVPIRAVLFDFQKKLTSDEEMARILRFFQWKARDWQQKGNARVSQEIPKPMSEAYTAYAERREHVYSLHSHFKKLWSDLPAHVTHLRPLPTVQCQFHRRIQKKKKVRGRPRKEP